MKLWYREPAKEWLQALPIGNGRLGAMVFGGIAQEHIQLNEGALWAGAPMDRNNPGALHYLPKIRRLLFEGKHAQAEELALKYLRAIPERIRPYQPLGDLWFEFPNSVKAVNYRRELDLSTGAVRITYEISGVRFIREIFTSAPDQILVVRMQAGKPGMLDAAIGVSSKLPAATGAPLPDTLILRGQIIDVPSERGHHGDRGEGGYGLRFETQAKVILNGGKFISRGDKKWQDDGKIHVQGGNGFTLILAAATNYYGEDPAVVCRKRLENALKKPPITIRNAAQADHAKFFNRVSFSLGNDNLDSVPTDKRLKCNLQKKNDPNLAALHFQFGRYALISCSRPGSTPANLQGIWNDSLWPPWSSNYTLNLNLQMNYWLAEVTNLAECHEPLFNFIARLRETGRLTAQKTYGCHGWVAHHNSDLWASSAPFNGEEGIWPMGGAWLSMHLWEHYEYCRERRFLAESAYPIMKDAAQFFLDFLVEDDKGRLVTNPSVSPENQFKTKAGKLGWLCVGATMDFEIIHDLFTHCIEAAEILGVDQGFCKKLESALRKLPPLKVGRHGQLQEWLEDYDEVEVGHRHISHLYAFFPGSQITLRGTPELAVVVRRTLERRLSHGGGGSGVDRNDWNNMWAGSNVWMGLMWTRLQDGERAYACVQRHMALSFQNLFSVCGTVFQIDATLGITAMIAEMLLQSHAGEIDLLPALPQAWPDGDVQGLRARGGYTVDIHWRHGVLKKATLRAAFKGVCRVRFRGKGLLVVNNGVVQTKDLDENLVMFPVNANTVYILEIR